MIRRRAGSKAEVEYTDVQRICPCHLLLPIYTFLACESKEESDDRSPSISGESTECHAMDPPLSPAASGSEENGRSPVPLGALPFVVCVISQLDVAG